MALKDYTILAAIVAGTSLSAAAHSQSTTPTPPAPCSSEEYRQLDFWVGDWHAEWDNGDGTTGHGENRVTRGEFGDCVIYERFSTDQFPGVSPVLGMSVSTYFPPSGQWRQTWVDNQGSYFALVGGPVEGEAHTFELTVSQLNENAPQQRMIWQDVAEDRFTWRWQGRASADEDWADRWVIDYTRMEE
jgi:hypothetical protein